MEKKAAKATEEENREKQAQVNLPQRTCYLSPASGITRPLTQSFELQGEASAQLEISAKQRLKDAEGTPEYEAVEKEIAKVTFPLRSAFTDQPICSDLWWVGRNLTRKPTRCQRSKPPSRPKRQTSARYRPSLPPFSTQSAPSCPSPSDLDHPAKVKAGERDGKASEQDAKLKQQAEYAETSQDEALVKEVSAKRRELHERRYKNSDTYRERQVKYVEREAKVDTVEVQAKSERSV